MGDMQEVDNDMMRRLQSSVGTSSSSIRKQSLSLGNQIQMDIPLLNNSQMRPRHFSQVAQNFSADGSKRVGIPPTYPNQIPSVSPYS